MGTNGIPEVKPDTIEELKAKLDEVTKERDNAFKRMKDTQASYTKGQQKNKELEAQIQVYKDQLILASADTPELEELKLNDPDAWYAKKRSLELETQQKFNDKLAQVSQEAIQAQIKEANEALLRDFKERNPQITDELINDVPFRIHSKLQNGQVSFGEFLSEVEDYYKQGKVVGGQSTPTLEQPDLGKMGNASNVTNTTLDYESFADAYRKNVI